MPHELIDDEPVEYARTPEHGRLPSDLDRMPWMGDDGLTWFADERPPPDLRVVLVGRARTAAARRQPRSRRVRTRAASSRGDPDSEPDEPEVAREPRR